MAYELTAKHWIDGTWIDSVQRRPSIDPAKGETIGTYADGSEAEAVQAIAAARRAFLKTGWRSNRVLRAKVLTLWRIDSRRGPTTSSRSSRLRTVRFAGGTLRDRDGPAEAALLRSARADRCRPSRRGRARALLHRPARSGGCCWDHRAVELADCALHPWRQQPGPRPIPTRRMESVATSSACFGQSTTACCAMPVSMCCNRLSPTCRGELDKPKEKPVSPPIANKSETLIVGQSSSSIRRRATGRMSG